MKNYMKFLKTMMENNRKLFFQAVLFILGTTAIAGFLPLCMREFITVIGEKESYSLLLICVGVYGVLLILYNLVDVEWYRFSDKLGGHVLDDLRQELYRAITQADYEKLLQIGKEKIKYTLYMETLNMFSSVTAFSVKIFAECCMIIVFLAISAFINWKLTVVLIVTSVTGFIISQLSRKAITNASMSVNIKMKEDSKISNEFVDAMELAKNNNLDKYFSEKCRSGIWDFIHTSRKADRTLIFLKNLLSHFHQLVSMGIAAMLSMTMKGSTVGDLVYYLFVTDMVLNTSQSIEQLIYQLMRMMPSFENVYQILALEKRGGEKETGAIETIEFRNVSFYYENAENGTGKNAEKGSGNGLPKQIMTDKNVQIQKGDVVRISGVNGGGKSTFVKLVKGLLYPKSGEVLLNNIPTNEIAQKSLREEILYIDQDEILLNGSVKEYLETIAERDISGEEMRKLKEEVHFDEAIETIADNGRSLSGGQRKKLLMMKLLLKYRTSSVIILDELEAGLDAATKEIVMEIEERIVKEKRDCIIFKITHEFKEDPIFTKVVRL